LISKLHFDRDKNNGNPLGANLTKNYAYEVKILFDEIESKASIFEGFVQYGSKNRTDKMIINEDSIFIFCNRTNLIDLDGVFNNYKSIIYGQIIKALAFYMGTKKTAPNIKSIQISCKKNQRLIASKKITSSHFQHKKFHTKFQGTFKSASLRTIFEENKKGASILKTITYVLRSKTKEDVFDRFETLWKGYNGLYKEITQETNDHNCHVKLRAFILANPNATLNTQKILSKLDSADLRSKIRWRDLILNDFDTSKKAVAFKEFVCRYSDSRLLSVLNLVLNYRIEMLKNAVPPLDLVTQQHITDCINANQQCDSEIVAFLCIKYMYFVRNKSVHGERIDRIVGITNKETDEVTWLSNILESLVVDLVNAQALY